MKKIIFQKNDDNTINYSDVQTQKPIFIKEKEKLVGMVVCEKDRGWIAILGGRFGINGHYDNLRDCLTCGQKYGYEFFVN